MAKKEYVKLTPEGLRLVTVLDSSSIAEINGFYQNEVFFTEGFKDSVHMLFQCLGNFGAFAHQNKLDKDVAIVIISNSLLDSFDSGLRPEFIQNLEDKLNQNNSPFRRLRILSEDQLITYIENRIKQSNDTVTKNYLQEYKDSNISSKTGQLF